MVGRPVLIAVLCGWNYGGPFLHSWFLFRVCGGRVELTGIQMLRMRSSYAEW